jgi:hypothetical protein
MSETEAKIVDEGVPLPPDKGEPPEIPADQQQPPALVPSSPKAPMVMSDRGIQLRSFAELWRFAQMVVASRAVPKGMNVGQAATAIQSGMEAGLTPMAALQAIVVINGVSSWRGQAALGLIRSKPFCRYIRAWSEGEGRQMRGVCVSRRAGADREERTDFTVEQAIKAELWGKDGPWQQYPDRQLMWRAVGFHGKDHWSDVLLGFPIAEEAMDFVQLRDEPKVRESLPPPSSPDPLLADLQPAPAKAEPLPISHPDAEPPDEALAYQHEG